MFETATLTYGPSSKRVWTTAMGFTGQAMLLACAVLTPLVSPQTLGRALLVTTIVAPGVPPAPLPPGPRVEPRPHSAAMTQISPHGLFVPHNIPPVAAAIIDPEPEINVGGGPGVVGGGPRSPGNGGGGPGNFIERFVAEIGPMPAVRPPEGVRHEPPVALPKPPRITVLQLATPIHRVDPIYPVLARQAHISGTVELLGVLGTDGRIHELKVLRGHPLLVNAALDAVRQWTYAPTILNGVPVEVAAPITVTFILNR